MLKRVEYQMIVQGEDGPIAPGDPGTKKVAQGEADAWNKKYGTRPGENGSATIKRVEG